MSRHQGNRIFDVRRINIEENILEDSYYRLLRMPWAHFLASMLALYMTLNLAFAAGYWILPGALAHAPALGFFDYFSFSVQTMSTVGYGYLYPETAAANALVILQTIVSLFFTAALTGMIFAKFSAPRSRVAFSDNILLTTQNGRPVICLRIANFRANRVFEGRAHMSLLKDETSSEGERLRRVVDLRLQRDVTPIFAMSWTLFHVIDEGSPLHGVSLEQMRERNWDFIVTFTGMDEDIKAQIISHSSYTAEHVIRARKFADMITREGRDRIVDYAKFNEVEA